jgi:hypothetical protein
MRACSVRSANGWSSIHERSIQRVRREDGSLAVPEDDTEESRARREAAASESGTPISELDESDIVASADDEFLCSETLALWAMIRQARDLIRQG